MCEVFGFKRVTSMSEQLFTNLLSVAGAGRREKILRYKKREDAERALIAEVLIRAIICRKLHLPNKMITFYNNKYGKPFLRQNNNFHFNLSHAGEWVVCAVGSEPVGIDVEFIRPVSLTIAERFFSPEEYIALMKKKVSQQLHFFYELWTLKESYIKALGRGMSHPLRSFTMIIMETGIKCKTETENGRWFFRQYEVDPNYKLAVCSTCEMFPDRVVVEDIDSLAEVLLRSS
jgi:4'-phosphopantetheinyl transferase